MTSPSLATAPGRDLIPTDPREAWRAEHERQAAAREAALADLRAQLTAIQTAWIAQPYHDQWEFLPVLLDVFAAGQDPRRLEEQWIGALHRWLRDRRAKPRKRFLADRKLFTLTCVSCEEQFFSFRRDRRACSAACRQRLYRQRLYRQRQAAAAPDRP